MFVTDPVSGNSTLVKLVAPLNIELILVTEPVLGRLTLVRLVVE